MESALRVVRLLRGCMLGMVVLFVYMGERISRQAHHAPPQTVALIQGVLVVVCMGLIAFMLFIRSRMLQSSESAFRHDPNDAAAVQRWRAAHLLSYGISEGIALYSMVLRIIGGTFYQVLPFYVAGFALLLFLRPTTWDSSD